MIIQKATEKDQSEIVDFQLKMALETEKLILDKSLVMKGVGQVFNDPTKGFYLVAQVENNIVASMLLTPEWSDWRNGFYLWIQSLYVLPQFRKKGVFRKMYKHVKELVAHSDGYSGIKLYVDQDNIPAQEVYQRVGMQASHYHLFEWNKKNF